MKRILSIIAGVIAVAPCAFSVGWAQDDATKLDSVLHQLRDIKSKRESTGSEKSLKPTLMPSAHQTRQVEEAANEVARVSVQFAAAIGGSVKGIYEADDRREYNGQDVTAAERRAADATVLLIRGASVAVAPDKKTFDLSGGNIVDPITGTGLCTPAQAKAANKPEERFFDQPNPGFCSGFRIDKKHILTAGHCVETQSDCENTKFVFGFNTSRRNPEKHLPAQNLYQCKAIVGGVTYPDGADWRLLEVDRTMTYGSDLTLRTAESSPKLSVGKSVTVIGYPLGLPVKIANGATVRGFGGGFFVANLDTYEGNSGSAVFNSEALSKGKLLVEGILVRGEKDFDMTSPCYISKRCPTNGCRGEDVTLANEIVLPPH